MVDLGGTDPRLLADEDFVELLVRAVRADYEAFNRYSCGPDVRIRADIHVLGGSHDHRVDRAHVAALGDPHRERVHLLMFDGGHFYVNEHTDAVAELVNALTTPTIPSSSSEWRSRRQVASTPPRRTGSCCPNSGKRWARSRPTAAGPCATCWTGRGATASNGSTISAASSRTQRHSIPSFFGISPREAIAMDPQQRVALRMAWRALENSGINPDDLAGHDVGCYVGASVTGYGPDMAEFSNHSGHLITGTALGVISGRIAYTLGLAGPALTIDSSCASALAAFHVAVQSVRAGDCDMALAGGVCVMGSPGFFVEFSKQHALSDDGHCRPYSAHASGTVWAEGAAMFVLQRRSGGTARRPTGARRGARELASIRTAAPPV